MIFTRNIWQMLKDLVQNDVLITTGSGAPTNGTSGTGVGLTGPGSLYIRTATGVVYVNTNTKASPTWTVVGTQT
jgi:hypothetical protein